MPNLEYNFNSKDYQLVAEQNQATFTDKDYIRLIVYKDNSIFKLENGLDVRSAVFYSSLSENDYSINISPFSSISNKITTKVIGGDKNDFKIYTAADGNVYVKPNEIFNTFELPEGNYKLQIDCLKQVAPVYIGTDYLSNLQFPQYLEEFSAVEPTDILNVVDANYWNIVGRPDITDYIIRGISGQPFSESEYDIPSNLEFPPPSISQQSEPGSQGGTAPQTTPLEDFNNPDYIVGLGLYYPFTIREISTSRKEVRLKLYNKNIIDNSTLVNVLKNEFNNGLDEYQFNHLLSVSSGINIPITNYMFDEITDGANNQSIILRLYEPLPRSISNLSLVTIEKEVLITQTTDVFYFSDVPPSRDGSGLIPDEEENWINLNQNENLELQNYNDLTSSISNLSLQNSISGSDYNYPNLNTDFNLFENHTFFGSAKRKLVNFKNKIETIQLHYSNISSSLSASGVSVDSDSNELIQYRQDLFNKIDSEISSFTPYERFLYFDGQSESTASAPGLGKNYIQTIPVSNDSSYQGELGKVDGIDTVYHLSSKDLGTSTDINLFTNKYRIENKPFFNYDDSVYLSFLMKAQDGVSLTWDNKTFKTVGDEYSPGLYLPESSFYQNTISSPEITGSHYQRFIFEASQSFWAPTIHARHDIARIKCWDAGSKEIEILSSSMNIKTGSNLIKDSSGLYQNLTTVVTQSGVPFNGAVLPNGELFKIFHTNTLTSSLSGSWKVDDQISGSIVTDAMLTDFSGRENTGSVVSNDTIKISDGVIHPDTGKQYGKSILFVSESRDDIRFFSDKDFNYTRDDNFSLSVWAKRFHSDTGSADATNGNSQAIFTRGFSSAAYGIDYYYPANQVRAGVRGNSSQIQATFIMPDDLLEWHHIAFTYESGSSTGIKLYVDGELKDNASTGDGFQISGDSHFSASAANIGNVTDSLSIGSNDTIGGTNQYYNGFIQYPRIYNRTITQDEVKQLYHSPDAIIESKITDVRVSLKNPTNALPFDNLYHTSSAEWTSWYDGTYDSASSFDDVNIHSLENNLPLYIQDSNEYDELKDWLGLQGEQYDVIRNHIDSLGTLNDRGYKKTDSPAENTYPMLLNNIGWEAINPFSGSLNETLGSYLTGVTSIDDIKNNTWRKTLNNLLYVYKTKGTENSVRSLMNIYGYPPDVLKIKEFGGSENDVVDTGVISEGPPASEETQIDTDLKNQSGSIGYTLKKEKLWNYMFQGDTDRGLELGWWMDSAEIDTIEFVYKHDTTTQTQTILKSSGSLDETLWDLRLIPSTDGISSSFEFRLNNSNTGSDAIADNGISMSLDYSNMTDGQLWNVMLQRATGSVSGSGTNEYRLHSALQDSTKIQTYNYVTMSVSGGITNTYVTGAADSNYYANQNWIMTGSRHYLSSSNLYVGEALSGSMSQIKTWTTTLSHSKFRKHTLNKFSTLGNSITSHCKELIYHFKLNENYTTASLSSSTQTLHIIDSAPKHELNTDYSFEFEPLDVITGSCASVLYGYDIVDTVKLGLQGSIQDTSNDNAIIINPKKQIVGNLDATKTIFGNIGKKNYVTSPKLELNSSPQDFINNHILNNMDTFNFELYYGNPKYYYSSSYKELDDLREEFFDCSPIEVNVNQYIRAQENIFNSSVTNALKSSAPARSTLSDSKTNIGVTIKPTILERQKKENEEYSIEVNPNSPSSSLSMISTGSYQHNFVLSSLLELPKSASISMGSNYISESLGGRVITPQFLQPGGYTASLETPKTDSISPLPIFTGSLELPYSSSLSMGNTFVSESDNNRSVVPPFIQQGGVTASIEFPKSGSIEEITTQYTKEFVNIHDSWGTADTDTHFINYATKKSNVYSESTLDLRFIQSASAGSTITLSSIEVPDGENGITGSTNPDLSRFVYKTITYTAVSSSGTANLDFNGAFNADSSSVLFLTGSGTTLGAGSQSQAENLLAAITSSNGHDDSFKLNLLVTSELSIYTVLKSRIPIISKVQGLAANSISASIGHQTGSGPGGLEDAISIEPVNNAIAFTGADIGVPDFNDRHIETRYIFRMIGDTEHYSGSFNNSDNFSNASYFYNREQITENLGLGDIKYESFINGDSGLQDGRMMGKTRYFYTGSDGNIILPANHISKFSTPFKDRMYQGAKNVSPGFFNSEKYEDYSSASFYRVKVTGGENQIIVKGDGSSTLDSDDNIIY